MPPTYCKKTAARFGFAPISAFNQFLLGLNLRIISICLIGLAGVKYLRKFRSWNLLR